MLLLGGFHNVVVDEVLLPRLVAMDEGVDGAPVRKTANVAVVDEHVGLDLAAEVATRAVLLFEVTVYGIEGHAALLAPIYGFVEKVALADAPKDETMAFFSKAAESNGGEGTFLANGGVTMLDDGAVEIYCDGHCLLGF